MNTFKFIEKKEPILNSLNHSRNYRRSTLWVSALTGFLCSFLILEKKLSFSYGFNSPFDQFFKWLHYGHTNWYVLYLMPVIFVLFSILIFRFIDYYKAPVAEQDDGANMEPAVNVTIPAEQEVAP
jgi:hypothetical protein